MKKKEFKVGDKVIVTKSEYNGKGTVVCVSGDLYLIKFDEEIGTYNYNASFKYKSYKKDLWCVTLSNIKHIKKTITKKELLKRIETLEALVGVEKKKELEVGKWYKYGRSILNYQGLKYKLIQAYGVLEDDSWLETDNCGNTPEEWKEANPQEVEEALIKEAKRRGFDYDSYIFDERTNMLWGNDNYDNGKAEKAVFDNGKWAEVIKNVDKFAELKESHKNGAVIQFRNEDTNNEWIDCGLPQCWYSFNEYRIKPDDKPKVGDVVKILSDDGDFGIKILVEADLEFLDSADIVKISQSEVISLLFNNGAN